MGAISKYIKGIGTVWQQKRLWIFFYLVLLFFGLLMTLPIHGMILEHLGYPLDIGRDLGIFDYTQVADLLNNHGEAIGIILYQAKWIFFFFFILSIFLSGGLVTYFFDREKEFRLSLFIQKCINNFWKYLRLNIYFLLFHLAILALSIFIYQLYLGSFSPFEIEDDSKLVRGFYLIAPIYLIIAIFIQAVSDIAKYNILKSSGAFITKPILSSFKTALSNIHHVIIFFAFHLGLYIFLFKTYGLVKDFISIESSFGFWMLIVIGQLFIALRVGMRLAKYAGLYELKRDIFQ